MNCDDPPNLAWTQQDLYIPQPTTSPEKKEEEEEEWP